MQHIKAILTLAVAIAAALVTALGTGNTDFGDIDTKSWLVAALAVLGSGGLVAFVQNTRAAPVIKTIIAGLTAGIGSLILALDDSHITQAEWLTAFTFAALATGLVYQTPDPAAPDPMPGDTPMVAPPVR